MEFLCKVDNKTGELKFASPVMEATYKKMMKFYGSTGTYFRFALLEDIKPTNKNQHNLFKRLCIMVASSSGETYNEIMKSFHTEHAPTVNIKGLFGDIPSRRKSYEEMNMHEFNIFIDKCIHTANDLFNMNLELYFDDKIGTVLTNKENA